MTKNDYLDCDGVHPFIEWFSSVVTGATPIDFNYQQGRHDHRLEDTLSRYAWPPRTNNGPTNAEPEMEFNEAAQFNLPAGSGLAINDAVLGRLECGLRNAFGTPSLDVTPWVVAILVWGGVYTGREQKERGNKGWVRTNRGQLRGILTDTRNAFAQDTDELKGILPDLRFNAGLTKIYSLLMNDFVIYDSRVAAALAWLVQLWCREEGRSSPPKELRFACMRANEPRNVVQPKIRNPAPADFPYVNARAYVHAKWNVRANWILASAFDLTSATKGGRTGPFNSLRKIEAALFTMGYDLRHACA